MSLVKEIPFKNSATLICGVCKGEGAVFSDNKMITCSTCDGHGRLIRETEGVMRLYTLNTKKNDTIL